eukprot:m.60261 g.60261  ORF g.60261 m.60261 type:complete len:559 (+) comp11307_c0_seq1:348-2024(+)
MPVVVDPIIWNNNMEPEGKQEVWTSLGGHRNRDSIDAWLDSIAGTQGDESGPSEDRSSSQVAGPDDGAEPIFWKQPKQRSPSVSMSKRRGHGRRHKAHMSPQHHVSRRYTIVTVHPPVHLDQLDLLYSVAFETNLPIFDERRSLAQRRFSHFIWLMKRLGTRIARPSGFSSLPHSLEAVEKQRKELEIALNILVTKHKYQSMQVLHVFLQSTISEDRLQWLVSTDGQHQVKSSKSKQDHPEVTGVPLLSNMGSEYSKTGKRVKYKRSSTTEASSFSTGFSTGDDRVSLSSDNDSHRAAAMQRFKMHAPFDFLPGGLGTNGDGHINEVHENGYTGINQHTPHSTPPQQPSKIAFWVPLDSNKSTHAHDLGDRGPVRKSQHHLQKQKRQQRQTQPPPPPQSLHGRNTPQGPVAAPTLASQFAVQHRSAPNSASPSPRLHNNSLGAEMPVQPSEPRAEVLVRDHRVASAWERSLRGSSTTHKSHTTSAGLTRKVNSFHGVTEKRTQGSRRETKTPVNNAAAALNLIQLPGEITSASNHTYDWKEIDNTLTHIGGRSSSRRE